MFAAQPIAYDLTHSFTKITLDYLKGAADLEPFFAEPPSLEGIKNTIEKKKVQPLQRGVLVSQLQQQYAGATASDAVNRNIALLNEATTFTVCTAHQPNLFTGPLYFIYKIVHAIKLADQLKAQLPEYNFVPVYYMGSEDADFEELNHTYLEGKKLEWNTAHSGAVGRMRVDKALLALIDEMEGQLSGKPFGPELIQPLRDSYQPGSDIQTATFKLVHHLFGAYGLVVLIADETAYKAQMLQVFEDDLFNHKPASIVQQSSEQLATHYNAQAYPRPINLFYLKDNIRERIEFVDEQFVVLNTDLQFTREEMKAELQQHPERFSPNVILRGLFQETILPNIAFIGGGGELAYWLQLKALFAEYNIVYPVLVLRNSFLIVAEKWKALIDKLGLGEQDLFASEDELMRRIVLRMSAQPVSLEESRNAEAALFDKIKAQAGAIDHSLLQHVEALKTRSLNKLLQLEKKMLRAEKRKFSDQQRQIHTIKEALFPKNGLQERKENFSSFYASFGPAFIQEIYHHSPPLEQEFTILSPSS